MTPRTDLADIGAPVTPARAFLIQALFWNVALFGLIRLSWMDRHFIGSLVEFQKSRVFSLWRSLWPPISP